MKTNHTPAPWTQSKMRLGPNVKDRRSGFVVNGLDANPLPVRICDIRCSPEVPFAEALANAQLIAAAPDLLAALQLLLYGAEQAQRQGLNQPQVNGGIVLARAALLKALPSSVQAPDCGSR